VGVAFGGACVIVAVGGTSVSVATGGTGMAVSDGVSSSGAEAGALQATSNTIATNTEYLVFILRTPILQFY
jgi:hypothetical protein